MVFESFINFNKPAQEIPSSFAIRDISTELQESRKNEELASTSLYIDYINKFPCPVPHLLVNSKFYLITNYILSEHIDFNIRKLTKFYFKNIQNIFLESTVSGDDRLKLSKAFDFFDNMQVSDFDEKWKLYLDLYDEIRGDKCNLANSEINNLLNRIIS